MKSLPSTLRLFPPLLILLLCASLLDAKTNRHRVIWIDDPSTTAVIAWNQDGGKNPEVRYDSVDRGKSPADYPQVIRPSRREKFLGMDTHFVYLESLQPGTPYYFLVADSDGVSRRFWFRTAPDKPEAFTFVAGGDTKSEDKARARGRLGNRLVARLRPLFVLYCGDFTSGDGLDPENWRKWLDDWATDTVAEDGRLFPIVPVRGNHEADPEILQRLFGLRDPAHHFAFNIGGDLLRVYALNSQIHVNRKNADGGGNNRHFDTPAFHAQTAWLIDDLERNQDVAFKLASYHKPLRPHTKGKPENDHLYDAWADAFYRYGMTLALEGDSHMHKITYPVRPSTGPGSAEGFIRDDEKGIVFVGEGSWGANVRPNNDDKPWTLHSASVTQLKWAHVYPDHMELRTVLTENAEEVTANSEKEVLCVPQNLRMLEVPGYGDVIRIPFRLNAAASMPAPAARR